MPTMDMAVFVLGICLVIAALVLIFRNQSAGGKQSSMPAIVLLLLGVASSLSGPGYLADFKGVGIEARIDKKVVDTKSSVNEALGPINLSVQELKQALDRQQEFNKTLSASVDSLLRASNAPATQIPLGSLYDTSTAYAENAKFSVLIFYRDSRRNDAQGLVAQLVKKGFQASAISTDFSEFSKTGDAGAIKIVATSRGGDVGRQVFETTKALFTSATVSFADANSLARGDVQIYMF